MSDILDIVVPHGIVLLALFVISFQRKYCQFFQFQMFSQVFIVYFQ